MNGNCRWGAYGLSQEMEIQKLGETFKTSKLNNNWSFYELQVTTCSFNKNHCYQRQLNNPLQVIQIPYGSINPCY